MNLRNSLWIRSLVDSHDHHRVPIGGSGRSVPQVRPGRIAWIFRSRPWMVPPDAVRAVSHGDFLRGSEDVCSPVGGCTGH